MSVSICGPLGRYRTVVDQQDGELRWCFTCRAQRVFHKVIKSPTHEDDMWYGPIVGIYCQTCNTNDGDCFPGRYREWDI